jgi:hypothetical protein
MPTFDWLDRIMTPRLRLEVNRCAKAESSAIVPGDVAVGCRLDDPAKRVERLVAHDDLRRARIGEVLGGDDSPAVEGAPGKLQADPRGDLRFEAVRAPERMPGLIGWMGVWANRTGKRGTGLLSDR